MLPADIQQLNTLHLVADRQQDVIHLHPRCLSLFRDTQGAPTALAEALASAGVDLEIAGTPEKRTVAIVGFASLQCLAQMGVLFEGDHQYRPNRNDALPLREALSILNRTPMKGPAGLEGRRPGYVVSFDTGISPQLKKADGHVPPLRYTLQCQGLEPIVGSDGIAHLLGQHQLERAAELGLNFPQSSHFLPQTRSL
jgi:hypothetical protein